MKQEARITSPLQKPKSMNYIRKTAIYCLMALLISCGFYSEEMKDEMPLPIIVTEAYNPLDSVLNDYFTENKVSGGVGLVFEKGEMVFHSAFGNSDIENQRPFGIS